MQVLVEAILAAPVTRAPQVSRAKQRWINAELSDILMVKNPPVDPKPGAARCAQAIGKLFTTRGGAGRVDSLLPNRSRVQAIVGCSVGEIVISTGRIWIRKL
ncbi:MAG TPA: hypothetical protein VGS41_19410 [Chthonomonadales bacterium]|nr:hypothetical protein [Chthonomonadales bacterium]